MRKIFSYNVLALVAFLGLCFIPFFALKLFLIGLALSTFLILMAVSIRQIFVKYIFIVLFSFTLPLTIIEGYSYILINIFSGSHKPTQLTMVKGKASSTSHPDVGYVPLANNVSSIKASQGNELIYQATYTTNANGWRITPEHPQAKTAILLFGCSFTFGEGLNDTQVLAYQLGQALGNDYQVYNFGFSGYGLHNSLAIIENILPDLQKYDNVQTYFITIEDHLLRAAGILSWNNDQGPRYLVKNDKAIRKGTFADIPPFPWERKYFKWLTKSNIVIFYRKQLSQLFQPLNTYEKRLELLRAIIYTAKVKLDKVAKNNISTVLVWPTNNSNLAKKLPPLKGEIPIIDMQDWLPNYADDMEKYIIPIDRHPNVLANTLIAKKLTRLIQNQKK